MLVNPELLRVFAHQADMAAKTTRTADVGHQASTAADLLPASRPQWAMRLVGEHLAKQANDVAKNLEGMGAAVRGAGDKFEVEDNALAGNFDVSPDEFFTHPTLTTVGGALTGLEVQAKRGIPMLTPGSMEDIGKAAKYGGPTLGVATALYDTVTAKTYQDACVAAVSGGASVAGGYASGTFGAGLATGFANPELAPPSP